MVRPAGTNTPPPPAAVAAALSPQTTSNLPPALAPPTPAGITTHRRASQVSREEDGDAPLDGQFVCCTASTDRCSTNDVQQHTDNSDHPKTRRHYCALQRTTTTATTANRTQS